MRPLLAALLLSPALAAADARVPVVVLYFDNNTASREYDVLQKGLADMLITDLAGSSQLQVVEREKLESLLAEHQLQKSKLFDAATATRVGKLVGAHYAVTGAFAAFDPELRLDVRLLDVESSKVVVTQSVRGKKEKFFDLEEELVKKFLEGLKAHLPAAGGKGANAGDFAAALGYSQSLDTADQGDLKAASTKLAAVVRNSPDFSLAKTRYRQLLERLRAAGKKRDEKLEAMEKDLVASVDAALKVSAGKGMKGTEGEVYFCYRAMRTAYLLWKLEQSLAPASGPLHYRTVNKVGRAETAKWVRAVWENETALIDDAVKNHDWLQYDNHALSCPMTLDRAKSPDFPRLRPLGIPWYPMPSVHPGERTSQLVTFAVTGSFTRARFDDQEDELPEVRALPTLVTLDPGLAPKMLRLLDAAKQHLELPMSRNKETETLKLEAARAGLLLRLGRREEAIATLQAFLEKYPTSRAYKGLAEVVEGLLGVSEKARRQTDGIVKCTALEAVVKDEVDRRYDADGVTAVKELLDRVDAGCALKKKVAAVGAWNAAVRGDCAAVKDLAGLAEGEETAGATAVCE